jgi:hypothetical protein
MVMPAIKYTVESIIHKSNNFLFVVIRQDILIFISIINFLNSGIRVAK